MGTRGGIEEVRGKRKSVAFGRGEKKRENET